MRWITLILCIISFLLGGVLTYSLYEHKPKIEIKEIKTVETKYIRIPVTQKEMEECVKSSIIVEAKEKGDVIVIRAHDKCKETTAEIIVEAQKNPEEIIRAGLLGVAAGALIVALISIL